MVARLEQDGPRDGERVREVREKDNRVWDMVLHQIHPTFIYVLLQLVILSHLGRSAAIDAFGPLHPLSLAVYGMQFLGAWAVFYTTLLRDMQLQAPEGTLLLLWALAGAALQYLVVPNPSRADDGLVWTYLGIETLPGGVLWITTMRRWRRARRRQERGT